MNIAAPIKYPVTRAKTPQGVLNAAAQIIEKFGWHQGHFQNRKTGAVCFYGAINAALTGNPTNADSSYVDEAAYLAAERINPDAPEDVWLAEWNDEKDRTIEEVLAVMRGHAGQTS